MLSGSNQSLSEESSSTPFTLEQLRSWIDVYEVAVTNHYSPELRAKVHAARINGISAEFRESTQGALLGHRCRVAPSYDVGPETFEDKVFYCFGVFLGESGNVKKKIGKVGVMTYAKPQMVK